MAEWVTTNNAQFWRHTPCGEDVRTRHGLPERHVCTHLGAGVSYRKDGGCFECGATVHPSNYGQHSNFHANFIHRAEVKDGFAVSAVKWCDKGNHAFKAGEPGSQSFTGTNRNDDGSEETVHLDMCAEHSFSLTNNTVAAPRMRQVEAAYLKPDEAPETAAEPPMRLY